MPENLHISVFLLALILIFPGCAQKEDTQAGFTAKQDAVVIDGVPFVRQKDKFCGPAAMASVLEYYGQEISQDEIAEQVYTPKLKGALISDMENFAREQGYSVEASNGNFDTLKAAIDKGSPVILLVDRGTWKVSIPHYYVVYGYAEGGQTFLLHSGDEGGREMSFDELDAEWERMNRLMLVVTK